MLAGGLGGLLERGVELLDLLLECEDLRVLHLAVGAEPRGLANPLQHLFLLRQVHRLDDQLIEHVLHVGRCALHEFGQHGHLLLLERRALRHVVEHHGHVAAGHVIGEDLVAEFVHAGRLVQHHGALLLALVADQHHVLHLLGEVFPHQLQQHLAGQTSRKAGVVVDLGEHRAALLHQCVDRTVSRGAGALAHH